jgi:UDP-N-acetyl-D-glucosamine dehydrogenase
MAKGAEVSYHDPYIGQRASHDGWEMASVPDLMQAVREADCVVIVTNHKVYDYPAILDAAQADRRHPQCAGQAWGDTARK